MRKQRRHSSPVEGLRLAIDCMPVATREAMLEALRAGERIISGAYVDRQGGVCPMLAAHRRGGRTDFISFARSWDRFTRVSRQAREATPRELSILTAQLEESLTSLSGLELDAAICEHRALRVRRLRERRRMPDAGDPSGEIRARRIGSKPGRRVAGDNFAPGAERRLLLPVPSRG
jgi:hypothetical protein